MINYEPMKPFRINRTKLGMIYDIRDLLNNGCEGVIGITDSGNLAVDDDFMSVVIIDCDEIDMMEGKFTRKKIRRILDSAILDRNFIAEFKDSESI